MKMDLKLTLSKNKQFIVKLGSIVLVCVIMLLKMLLLFLTLSRWNENTFLVRTFVVIQRAENKRQYEIV